ncbi:thiol peroxidase [Enterococcus songbeiensis]|uniref:thiol peroxidase n=1 Tax=Enterococcus songbeiensis TaxID=2559927 RepID=UPI0024829EA6|nr:thiol peroxidase [Enterococcus songbeiensis]
MSLEVSRKGTMYKVPGKQPQVGELAPFFQLPDLQEKSHSLPDFKGKPTILSVIPDIDTRVCALQTKRFNQEASKISAIHFVTISNNTKEQQAAWCGQEGVDMLMLHDTDHSFGDAYGLWIPEFGHLARAIFVLDSKGVVQYQEISQEISQEPNYEQALAAANALI